MFFMDTGLFISHIGVTSALFHQTGDAITDKTPSLKDHRFAVHDALAPYVICGMLFEILNVSSLLNP